MLLSLLCYKIKTKEVKNKFICNGKLLIINSSNLIGCLPLFKEQIKNGGLVTVTDPKIIRFFMLILEACKLVLEAGRQGTWR